MTPVIETAIRILYLGLMGWIASKVTSKGLNVLRALADLDRSNERILTNVTCYGSPPDSVLVSGTFENYGSLSVQIVSLWVVNADNTKYTHAPLDIFLAPGNNNNH